MKKYTFIVFVIVFVALFLVACEASYEDDTASNYVSAENVLENTEYGKCVVSYTVNDNVEISGMTYATEIIITYNEGCNLPNRLCTYIDGGNDGGLSCIPID